MGRIKRLASEVVGKGMNKIHINPEKIEEAESAVRRSDVKELFKKGVLSVKKRVGGKKETRSRKKRGPGSKKGRKYSRKSKKELWMERVRAQRKLLRELIREGKIKKEARRDIYLKIKGGAFKGKRALLNYLQEHDLLINQG